MKEYLGKLRHLANSFKQYAPVKLFKRHKKTLAILVILGFVVFFTVYVFQHPEVLKNILKIGPLNLFLVFILYVIHMLTNVVITGANVELCNKQIKPKDNLLLTVYSYIINFFGPLQSGPAVRAIYLKTKLGIKIKHYVYSMLYYYGIFAALNISLLFIGSWWWLSLIGVILTIVLMILVTTRLGLQNKMVSVWAIFAATVVQIIVLVAIYSIELHGVVPDKNYSLSQTIIYSASANLALFVSLTPGAIGFRETFQVITTGLHHIPLASIISANIVDRAIYIVFLGLLFLGFSPLHLKKIFKNQDDIKS